MEHLASALSDDVLVDCICVCSALPDGLLTYGPGETSLARFSARLPHITP